MANIETLFHVAKLTKKPVYLMSEDSLGCLLVPVYMRIHFLIPADLTKGCLENPDRDKWRIVQIVMNSDK